MMVDRLVTVMQVSVLMSFLTTNLRTVWGSGLQLKLVNVVYRHGARTPEGHETFPTDPYMNMTYYPIGRGGLTLVGKQQAYQCGQLLRSRYDRFLGPFYTPTIVDARSTDPDRTKMSLQLLLAGIFPPQSIQRWSEDLLWQPIPTSYENLNTDHLLFPDLTCSAYIREYNRILNAPEVKKKITKFDGLMKTLEPLTGRHYNDTASLASLYHTFTALESSNMKLLQWVYDFYPGGKLLDTVDLDYNIKNYNDRLKRLNGGMLLSKILSDVSSHKNGTLPEGRKMYLYSGRAANIHSLQSALGVWKPHFPAYGSAVIIELWEDDGKYFVKVLYYTGTSSKLVTQKVPGCSALCPLKKFIKLLKPVTASQADLQCN